MPSTRIAFPRTGAEWAKEKEKWASHGGNGRFSAFADVVGATDGTQIPVSLTESGKVTPTTRWMCRKGFMATNALAVCNYDLMFTFTYVGAEGPIGDSTLIADSLLLRHIPDGAYLLCDQGGVLRDKLLIPFQKCRYHLQEFGSGRRKPDTPQELFNLRHSILRASRIEIAFGLLKQRWSILRKGITGAQQKVMGLIRCCFALHNYCQARSGNTDISDFDETNLPQNALHMFQQAPAPQLGADADNTTPAQARIAAMAFRDAIAKACFDSYRAQGPH
jgi:hypothetical protein